MQQLSSGEEQALADWMLLLAHWGWSVKIELLCDMAIELLQAKNDMQELEIH